jgi:hypothetical protein
MIEYSEHVNSFFMAFVIGAASLAVRQIQIMSHHISVMTTAIQVLSERLVGIDRMAQDHELRIRSIESNRS